MLKFLYVSLTIVMLATAFSSCKKNTDTESKSQGQVEITISVPQLKSALESTGDSVGSSEIASIIVSITDLKDNVVISSEKIELFNMNGYYISRPISLVSGSYKLSKFLVINGRNQVVFASPMVGSPKAYLVSKPLPLAFTVSKDKISKITPEVISTTESTPEDFGYGTFSFEVAETFDFLIGVFVYNDLSQNYELTSSNIKILNNTSVVYEGALKGSQPGGVQLSNYDDSGITNKITLPGRFDKYILKITKPGYKTYCDTFTKEELRLYYRSEDNGPLVVILERSLTEGLVAYYPFNGNAKDESGNTNNGNVVGATLTTDRFGNANKAYYFNGSSWIEVLHSNSLDLTEDKTISLWSYLPSGYKLPFYPTLISKNSATSYYPTYILQLNEYDGYGINRYKYDFFFGLGNSNYQCVSNSLYIDYFNKWVHISGVFSKSEGTIKVFINGILNNTSYVGSLMSNSNTEKLYIGRSIVTEKTYYTGKIDEIRIYNRALTQEEIMALYDDE